MLRVRAVNFFFCFVLVSFLGIQNVYCRQLSFKEGATASYVISSSTEEVTNASNAISHSQSGTTITLDVKILSSDAISHWFSRPSHLFTIEVLVKNILLSNKLKGGDQDILTEYDSTAKTLADDPVEQALQALIGTALQFQIGDNQIKEITMCLDTFAHLCQLSNKWKECEFSSLLQDFVKELFDLSGENLQVDCVYSLPCDNTTVLKDDLENKKVVSQSKVYKIHEIASEKTTASCTEIFDLKGSLKKPSITCDAFAKTTVTWDNENSLLQMREKTKDILMDSEPFSFRHISQESWRIISSTE